MGLLGENAFRIRCSLIFEIFKFEKCKRDLKMVAGMIGRPIRFVCGDIMPSHLHTLFPPAGSFLSAGSRAALNDADLKIG